jgi:hypothetical protein
MARIVLRGSGADKAPARLTVRLRRGRDGRPNAATSVKLQRRTVGSQADTGSIGIRLGIHLGFQRGHRTLSAAEVERGELLLSPFAPLQL